jgi:hypothetical protein
MSLFSSFFSLLPFFDSPVREVCVPSLLSPS